ncbi:uncharacterized protein [Montipora foliosa]|uniref:uncharacterized protein n=1 Tax=Montipora foliosa TaxID=591990 RepID=UPI0035F12A15
MDSEEVDRDATTKELENIEETVDRECVTVESAIGTVDREGKTVSSPLKITFCVVEPAPNKTALLKGIPTEPLHQPVGSQVLFGRGKEATVFLNDEEASKEHMKLSTQTNPVTGENVFVIQTVSTSKPVLINGSPLWLQGGATTLKIDDRLKIGQLEFIITVIPGDSGKVYEIEFTRSRVDQQHCYGQGVPSPQFRGHSGHNVIANQVGAVVMPNYFGMPPNLPRNMTSPFGPLVSQYSGISMPMAPFGHQTMPVNGGMGQFFSQPQPTCSRFQKVAYSHPHQETSYPGMYKNTFPQQEQATPAHQRREQFHAKEPSEQSEDPEETGQVDESHISEKETSDLQKSLPE